MAGTVGVLHATKRGANAGDDFACNTNPIGKLCAFNSRADQRFTAASARPGTLRASRYRTFSRGWAFRPKNGQRLTRGIQNRSDG